MSNFTFLKAQWPGVHEAASKAEAAVHPDARAACFYARRALELAVAWAYRSDPTLKVPDQDNLGALLHEPTFQAAAGEAVFVVSAALLYESPFTDLTPRGPDELFSSAQMDALLQVLEQVHASARAA